MRRAARQFAGSVDRGADVLFRSNSGEKFRSHLVRREENDRRSSTRPNLVVPRAEREEKYESQSLLKKLFSKKPTSELPERRHTGIEPDGAWSLPLREKSWSRKEGSRHESVRREPSRHEPPKREPSKREPSKQPSKPKPTASSSKVPSSTSRYPSIAGPPTRTPTVATKASAKSKASTSPAPHEKEIENWEERKKAAEKGVSKSGKTVKTVGYKLGNMARTIVEGQL
jgi:hypothetical protein